MDAVGVKMLALHARAISCETVFENFLSWNVEG
jgi:hypothetical protein